MADAIVNFKQSTEYKCDKLGYLSAPVGKVRLTLDEQSVWAPPLMEVLRTVLQMV